MEGNRPAGPSGVALGSAGPKNLVWPKEARLAHGVFLGQVSQQQEKFTSRITRVGSVLAQLGVQKRSSPGNSQTCYAVILVKLLPRTLGVSCLLTPPTPPHPFLKAPRTPFCSKWPRGNHVITPPENTPPNFKVVRTNSAISLRLK